MQSLIFILFSFLSVRNMVCELQPLPGPCGARYIRWYFNKHAHECAYFRYGGCQGNQNNFKSKADCESACMGVSSISLYNSGQSSLSAVKPAIMTAPIYEPPEVKMEALNSIMITGNEQNYDRYSQMRHRKMQHDDSNTRKRRRLDKERAKERRRRERRKERKRLKRLRQRQKKLLRDGKKSKKDRKKKKNRTEDEDPNETAQDNAVGEEKNVDTVEEITNMVDNAISEDDVEETVRRRDRRRDKKRRKRRQKRQKKNRDRDSKSRKQKRDNKYAESRHGKSDPSYQRDDSRSYRMLSILDQIAKSRTQSGSIVYSEPGI